MRVKLKENTSNLSFLLILISRLESTFPSNFKPIAASSSVPQELFSTATKAVSVKDAVRRALTVASALDIICSKGTIEELSKIKL